MIVHHAANGGDAIVILACNDSSVKVVADNGRLQYQAILDSAPTCISAIEQQEGGQALIILYGLQNGNIGAMELGVDEAIVLWELNCN